MYKLLRDIKNVVVSKFLHGCNIHVVTQELRISLSYVQRIRQEHLFNLECLCVNQSGALSCT
jgi:DNA-directed RNA polymerase specialized sigma subunit